MKKKITFILGIRPDIIRAHLILKYLKKNKEIETIFIWSGQHYSENLKDIFFKELGVSSPTIELNCNGRTDTEFLSKLTNKLYNTLQELKPDATVFLGDTNTVASCIAPALLNIPIVHIEGGMRSYDWRMPEEKYRTVSDHLADLIYVYMDDYKKQIVREGINPKNVVVVGNPIVDVLNDFYFKRKKAFKEKASSKFFKDRKIEKGNYVLMTCHRRENLENQESLLAILNLISNSPYPVYFPASYRTQKVIKRMKMKLPKNVLMTDPIGYEELITLVVNSKGTITDSGTIVEECSILNIPTIQMRKSTERPQVYDVGGCIKFDPTNPKKYPASLIFAKLEKIQGKKWKHILGDGKSSERIANDLAKRVLQDKVRSHKKSDYGILSTRSYREDEIKI